MKEMQKQFNLAKNINDAGAMNGDSNAMGNILFEAGKYDEAKAKFTEALSVIETSSLAEEVKENTRRLNIYNMGRIALMNAKMEDAKKIADEFSMRSTAANNTFQILLAHQLDGLTALREKEYKKAISEIEKDQISGIRKCITIWQLLIQRMAIKQKLKSMQISAQTLTP